MGKRNVSKKMDSPIDQFEDRIIELYARHGDQQREISCLGEEKKRLDIRIQEVNESLRMSSKDLRTYLDTAEGALCSILEERAEKIREFELSNKVELKNLSNLSLIESDQEIMALYAKAKTSRAQEVLEVAYEEAITRERIRKSPPLIAGFAVQTIKNSVRVYATRLRVGDPSQVECALEEILAESLIDTDASSVQEDQGKIAVYKIEFSNESQTPSLFIDRLKKATHQIFSQGKMKYSVVDIQSRDTKNKRTTKKGKDTSQSVESKREGKTFIIGEKEYIARKDLRERYGISSTYITQKQIKCKVPTIKDGKFLLAEIDSLERVLANRGIDTRLISQDEAIKLIASYTDRTLAVTGSQAVYSQAFMTAKLLGKIPQFGNTDQYSAENVSQAAVRFTAETFLDQNNEKDKIPMQDLPKILRMTLSGLGNLCTKGVLTRALPGYVTYESLFKFVKKREYTQGGWQ